MNCREIVAILDDHQVGALNARRRAAVEAHLAECSSCADAWLVNDALIRGRIPAVAPSGLFAELTKRLEREPIEKAAGPRRRGGWRPPVGALAASVALVGGVGVLFYLGLFGGSEVNTGDVGRTAQTPLERDDLPASVEPGARAETAVSSTAAAVTSFELGRHYAAVAEAPPLMAARGETEVVQFFMYGCNPCYAFESHLERWSASAQDVELVRVPVVFNAQAGMHAQAFYAAEALGKLDEMHAAFFTEIHVSGNRLDTVQSLSEFFERFGVAEEEFVEVFNSPEIVAKVERAAERVAEQRITATPALVVGGRYMTSPMMAGSYEALIDIVDELTESLRAEDLTSDAVSPAQPRRLTP